MVEKHSDRCRGGASGLAAAIAAAENGAAVTLLEQNENPGLKSKTGNAKCNLTNRDMRPDIFRGRIRNLWKKFWVQFTLEDTLAFFEKLGWLYRT